METATCQSPTMALLNLGKAERRLSSTQRDGTFCYLHSKLVESMVSGASEGFKPGFYRFLLVILSTSYLTYLSLNYTSHQKGVVINNSANSLRLR